MGKRAILQLGDQEARASAVAYATARLAELKKDGGADPNELQRLKGIVQRPAPSVRQFLGSRR